MSTNCLSVLDHFVKLALKGLRLNVQSYNLTLRVFVHSFTRGLMNIAIEFTKIIADIPDEDLSIIMQTFQDDRVNEIGKICHLHIICNIQV